VSAEIRVGHVLDVLRTLEAGRFQCVVTSPPYYAVRNYSTAPQVWGGSPDCAHQWQERLTRDDSRKGDQHPEAGTPEARRAVFMHATCPLCGAMRCELGMEPDPRQFVDHLLSVLAEVWRVLRDDGTMFLNLSDSYAANRRSGSRRAPGVGADQSMPAIRSEVKWHAGDGSKFRWTLPDGTKPKAFCLVPERVLIGLAEQGWILRNRIIWVKASRHEMRLVSMPTSAKDRLKPGWEPVFLLTKSGKYKGEVKRIGEPPRKSSLQRAARKSTAPGRGDGKQHGYSGVRVIDAGRLADPIQRPVLPADGLVNPGDVWFIPPQPRREAFYAAFPDALVSRCLQMTTDPGDEVLDPFVGRGTTVIVAKQLGRKAMGIELNEEYAKLAEANIRREASQGVLLPA